MQLSEAVEYHEQFQTLIERLDQWMTDVEARLEKHTGTDGRQSDYAIEEHYESVEVRTNDMHWSLSFRSLQNLIRENADGESLLSNLDDCLEQVFKTTSIEGRTNMKYILTECQTRWSNYHLKQKQLKQMLHNVKMDRLEFDETLNEITEWLADHREKVNELSTNLSLRDENRKRLYQLKSFFNESNAKQALLRTLKEKFVDNDRLHQLEEQLEDFQEELRVSPLSWRIVDL